MFLNLSHNDGKGKDEKKKNSMINHGETNTSAVGCILFFYAFSLSLFMSLFGSLFSRYFNTSLVFV